MTLAMDVETGELISWDELCERGRTIRRSTDAGRWELGDLACAVVKAYGDDRLADFAREVGCSKASIKSYRRTSRFYEKVTRVTFFSQWEDDLITYTHYREAMRMGNLPDATMMLEQSAQNAWTTDELAYHIGKRLQPATPGEDDHDGDDTEAADPDGLQPGIDVQATVWQKRSTRNIEFQFDTPVDLTVGKHVRIIIYQED